MTDNIQNINLGDFESQLLENIDREVLNHFNKQIGLYVVENDNKIMVPVMLATHERWNQLKKDRVLRDSNKTVLLPICIVKRGTIESANPTINKSVADNPAFKVPVGSIKDIKQGESHLGNSKIFTNYPIYIKITYEMTLQSRFMSSMNSMIEQIIVNYFTGWFISENEYSLMWETSPITDSSNIEDFSDNEKIITNNFQFMVTGAIVSKYQNDISNITRVYSPRKIIFEERVE